MNLHRVDRTLVNGEPFIQPSKMYIPLTFEQINDLEKYKNSISELLLKSTELTCQKRNRLSKELEFIEDKITNLKIQLFYK